MTRRHLYYTIRDGRDVVITLEREVPATGGFHLQVSFVDDTITPLYSSQAHPRRVGPDVLKYYREVLRQLGLQVPETRWEALSEDRALRGGIIEHFDDGSSQNTEL